MYIFKKDGLIARNIEQYIRNVPILDVVFWYDIPNEDYNKTC